MFGFTGYYFKYILPSSPWLQQGSKEVQLLLPGIDVVKLQSPTRIAIALQNAASMMGSVRNTALLKATGVFGERFMGRTGSVFGAVRDHALVPAKDAVATVARTTGSTSIKVIEQLSRIPLLGHLFEPLLSAPAAMMNGLRTDPEFLKYMMREQGVSFIMTSMAEIASRGWEHVIGDEKTMVAADLISNALITAVLVAPEDSFLKRMRRNFTWGFVLGGGSYAVEDFANNHEGNQGAERFTHALHTMGKYGLYNGAFGAVSSNIRYTALKKYQTTVIGDPKIPGAVGVAGSLPFNNYMFARYALDASVWTASMLNQLIGGYTFVVGLKIFGLQSDKHQEILKTFEEAHYEGPAYLKLSIDEDPVSYLFN